MSTTKPSAPKYLQHEEVKRGQWKEIWERTAPQARRRSFEEFVAAVGPLPMTGLATNGIHRTNNRKGKNS